MPPREVAFSEMETNVTGGRYALLQEMSPLAGVRATIVFDAAVKTRVGDAMIHGWTVPAPPTERTQRYAPLAESRARTVPSSAPKTIDVPARARGPVTTAGRVCDHIGLPNPGWSATTREATATYAAAGGATAAGT